MDYNNDIIKELFNYIKNYDGEDFINMDLILKQNFNILFLITPRNCGKSVGTMKYILKDCYTNNNEFLYIRNTEIELKTSNAIGSFYNYFDFIQPGLSKHFNIKRDGVYYDNNKKMGTFLYFSKSKNSKSQGELNNVKWIIYEEFINPDAIFKNCVNRFADIFKTYQRNNIAKAIFLGNKDDLLENDFLINFGIDFNINKTHNQYIWKSNKKILAILLNKTIKKRHLRSSNAIRINIF